MEQTDELIFAHNYFKELSRCYPSAKFILNIRDKNKWIESRLNHRHYTEKRRSKFGKYNLYPYAKDMMFRYGDLLNINFRKDEGSNSSDGPELLKKYGQLNGIHIYMKSQIISKKIGLVNY